MPGTKPDPLGMTDVYVRATVSEHRAYVGRSRRGWELTLATGLAVVFLAWAVWVFVLV